MRGRTESDRVCRQRLRQNTEHMQFNSDDQKITSAASMAAKCLRTTPETSWVVVAATPSSPTLPGNDLAPFHLAPPLQVRERSFLQARSCALSACAASSSHAVASRKAALAAFRCPLSTPPLWRKKTLRNSQSPRAHPGDQHLQQGGQPGQRAR